MSAFFLLLFQDSIKSCILDKGFSALIRFKYERSCIVIDLGELLEGSKQHFQHEACIYKQEFTLLDTKKLCYKRKSGDCFMQYNFPYQQAMIKLNSRWVFKNIQPLWWKCEYVCWYPTICHLGIRIVHETSIESSDESTCDLKHTILKQGYEGNIVFR